MKSSHRLLTLLLAGTPAVLFAQGVLTPPAAPAPSMKTLSQVEPRTPVSSLPGDASTQYIISQPGSYYLTGNLEGVAGKHGIKIAAKNVSLDLAGFTLHGADTSHDAIAITPDSGNVVVTNGLINNWGGTGIAGANVSGVTVSHLSIDTTKSGPGVQLGTFARAEHVTVLTAKTGGILLDANSLATHCTVAGVSDLDTPGDDIVCGIIAGTVSDCSVRGIVGSVNMTSVGGISAQTVENCSVAWVVGNNGTNVSGIGGNVVRGCSVEQVSAGSDQTSGIVGAAISDCFVVDVSGLNAAGLRAFGYGLLAHHNRLLRCGIVTGPGAKITDNSITLNPASGTGVLVEYTGSVIDGNQVNGGSIGIYVLGTNNRVVRNFVSGSTIKFNLAAGNQAPVAVVTADDITTAGPWANFSQ